MLPIPVWGLFEYWVFLCIEHTPMGYICIVIKEGLTADGWGSNACGHAWSWRFLRSVAGDIRRIRASARGEWPLR